MQKEIHYQKGADSEKFPILNSLDFKSMKNRGMSL